MAGRLQDKVAIVTGAGCVGPGWGNGRAAAVLFAREGATVFAVDRDAAAMDETLARVGRVRRRDRDACLRRDRQRRGRGHGRAACSRPSAAIDILVNNVGGSAAGGPVEMAEEVWDAQVDYNLKSVFLTCKHVLPVMEGQGARRHRQHLLHLRHALDRRGPGRLCGDQGRRDPVHPRRRRAIRQARASAPTRSCPARCTRRWSRRASPASAPAATSRRCSISGWRASRSASWATAATPRNAALFLASDEARFITGTEIVVDGGMTARCD